jgi:photosystem II stability/assembly factor-like uncharacterized protein
MSARILPGRVVVIAFLALGIVGISAVRGEAPADQDKQITELEKQIADLQAKLKAIQAKRAPMPHEVSPPDTIPQSWVNKFQWRSIGPATMGGRITGIAVYDADPTTYWVASASGGLLKTVNNGTTFEHQFDREATVSIGAVAVAPSDKNVVWVGTGENNPRNSVSYGDGVYKSTDGGKTWKSVGFKTSYQIGKIVIHPTKPDVVYVGTLGRLYGPGGERGLYKTEDGGKTWKNILPQLDDKTGVIEIAMNPTNPDTLLVAAWERQRDEFDSFLGDARTKIPGGSDAYAPGTVHGAGSAIYKTTDGGKTFSKLSKGLPNVKLGRVGFDWSRKNPQTVFAIIDTEKIGMGKPLPKAYLGVQSETLTGVGVKVTGVTGNEPAAKAGFKEEDVITAIDGKEIKTYEAMLDVFRTRNPGEKAKFTVTRGKDKVDLEVTFGTPQDQRPVIGVTPQGEAEGGVKIGGVSELGPATKAGIKPGDIITAIGDKAVKTPRELSEAIQSHKTGEKVKVSFIRAPGKQTVEVTLDPAGGPPNTRPHSWFGGGMTLGGQVANVQDQQGEIGPQTGGVYKSTDGGESWTRINSLNPRPFYFSVVRVDPTDDNTLYVCGIDLSRSTDGGKTFKSENINVGVHSDQHAMWIDPKDGRHMLLGTDGGFYVTYDKAAKWESMNHAGAIGQFYHVAVDNRTPYHVYGGLQDNGSWGGPSRSDRWPGPINQDWMLLTWGDGFVCRVDPNDPDVVYSESQDGNIARNNLRTGGGGGIRPQPDSSLQPYRFNWNTPFILSAHNSSIFYSAGNYVFRSVKRGTALHAASPEISLTKRGTGTALSESPRNPDVVWAGTDDGGVWVTKDGCKTWTNVSDKFKAAGLPGPRWVASIEVSKWADGRCYVVFDAHRSNDDNPYIFVTEDFGQTWKLLRGNLPLGSSRVLREDIANENLLYLGTEFGCYASVNRGGAWSKINGDKGLPTVAVHEFAQPTTANDLVVATHGRSIWVLDVTPLRQMTLDVIHGKTALFSPAPAIQWKRAQSQPFSESIRSYYGQNPPRGAQIDYVVGQKAQKSSITILDVSGRIIRDMPGATEPGSYRLTWDLGRSGGGGNRPEGGRKGKGPIVEGKSGLNPLAPRAGPGGQVPPGEYRVVLNIDGTEHIQTLIVEPDPNAPKSGSASRDEGEVLEVPKEEGPPARERRDD